MQALRQRVFSALTQPPLTYNLDGNVVALPSQNVLPSAPWEAGTSAPMPGVFYMVSAVGVGPRVWAERRFRVQLWVVSKVGPRECSEIYESIRALLHLADSESVVDGPQSLSRVGSGPVLSLGVRECIETRVSHVGYERETNRWYLSAEYQVTAL
jgi:hypothetical protein